MAAPAGWETDTPESTPAASVSAALQVAAAAAGAPPLLGQVAAVVPRQAVLLAAWSNRTSRILLHTNSPSLFAPVHLSMSMQINH